MRNFALPSRRSFTLPFPSSHAIPDRRISAFMKNHIGFFLVQPPPPSLRVLPSQGVMMRMEVSLGRQVGVVVRMVMEIVAGAVRYESGAAAAR